MNSTYIPIVVRTFPGCLEEIPLAPRQGAWAPSGGCRPVPAPPPQSHLWLCALRAKTLAAANWQPRFVVSKMGYEWDQMFFVSAGMLVIFTTRNVLTCIWGQVFDKHGEKGGEDVSLE